ncbi:hypothetical protein JX265_004840 [Neoarthrinium moseri]|uniref:Ankyrin repeat protein n=1 Tax=Neoarthrinium moseri TaxID=1658444 RepID=A0A9Q0AQW1_9PEZI|nr:hypothetical protein JX265_004840 [Neoarthrinium moseri]
MDGVSAVASFIAIGQALAAIPKVVKAVQAFANTREELEELLFELDILAALYEDVQMCFGLIAADDLPNVIAPKEPAYIERIKKELNRLLGQLEELAKQCPSEDNGQRLSKTMRIKWVWKKEDITRLCERARRIKDHLKSAMDMLAFRQSLQERRIQNTLILEMHSVTVERNAWAIQKGQWDTARYFLTSFEYMLVGTDSISRAAMHAQGRQYFNINLSDEESFINSWIIRLAEQDLDSTQFPLHQAVRDRHGLSDALLSHPSAIDQLDDSGMAPLHIACCLSNESALVALLNAGANPDVKDFRGDKPIHLAAAVRLPDFVRILVESGSDVNCLNALGMTPLMIALRGDSESVIVIVSYLIEHGASLFHKDATGFSVLAGLADADLHSSLKKELFAIIRNQVVAMVNTADDYGRTPLLAAVSRTDVTMTQLLIDSGARTDIANEHGFNVLHFAARYGSSNMYDYLLKAGILGLDIRQRNANALTPVGELWWTMYTDSAVLFPDERRPHQRDVDLFEQLLIDVRNRGILAECATLKSTIADIKDGNPLKARETLHRLAGDKTRARIEEEAETFRAIALYVRNELMELAIESLEEFMEVSRARLEISPFDEEPNPWIDIVAAKDVESRRREPT